MNKDVALLLRVKVEECAKQFSNPAREFNSNQETYSVNSIVSLGDDLASVVFDKSSGKQALAVFVFVKNYWIYFFPRAGHLLGWERIKEYYFEVEKKNFARNFEPVKLAELV